MKDVIVLILTAIITGIIGALIVAAILTPTWNYTLPFLFGIKKITFWRSFCLYIVIDCLVAPITSAVMKLKNND